MCTPQGSTVKRDLKTRTESKVKGCACLKLYIDM